LRTLPKLTGKTVIAVAVIAAVAILAATVFEPYVIGRGMLGRTPLDKPGFSVQHLQLSKNDTTCYISSTVHNTGNVWIAMLTLTLNRTRVWNDAWTKTGQDDLDRQAFFNYGDLHCADIGVGQTYTALFTAHFADEVDQYATTIVRVGNHPIN